MFHFVVVGGAARSRRSTAADRAELQRMERPAAWLGGFGAAVSAVLFATRLPGMAARQHLSVGELLASRPQPQLQAALVLVALVGFALAIGRVRLGWVAAALGVCVGPLTGLFFGGWARLATPIHRLAAGAWIGTLFMIVVAGIPVVLRSNLPAERRGTLVADLIDAFSPFALASAGTLAVFGVITAWLHLHTLAALWTTPYGITLIIKLIVVVCVVALGAFNWQRQKPLLGTEAGARRLRGSATAELITAGVVLLVTAILVSVPSPKPPGAAPAGGSAAPPAAPSHSH